MQFCQQCGSSNAADARFCSSCGTALAKEPPSSSNPVGESVPQAKPQRSAAKTVVLGCLGLLAAIVVIVIILAIIGGNGANSNVPSSRAPAPTSSPTGPTQPVAEAKFLASKDAIEARFDNAPNDMVKHQIAGEWQNGGSCPAVKSAQFTDWVGTIKTIQYDGTFEVDLGDDVTLNGSIDSTSPLFKEVSALHEGDTVKVSGTFSMDQAGSECIAQPTTDNLLDMDTGSVTNPDFNVDFSRVAPQSE
jgi:hypothetical protein